MGTVIHISPPSFTRHVSLPGNEHDDYEEDEEKKVEFLSGTKLLDLFHECHDKLDEVIRQIRHLNIDIDHLFLSRVDSIASIIRTVHMNVHILHRNCMNIESFETLQMRMMECINYLINRSAMFTQQDTQSVHKIAIARMNETIAALHLLVTDPVERCPALLLPNGYLEPMRISAASTDIDEQNGEVFILEKNCCGCYTSKYNKKNLACSFVFLCVVIAIIVAVFYDKLGGG
jgi:hypothetical protein